MTEETLKRYKNKEKRRKYNREYNRKWRQTERGREYHRQYMRNRRGKRVGSNSYFGTSGLGRKYELLALQILEGSVDCNNESFRGKHDLLWNNKKIEVKIRNKKKNGYYGFTTKKQCDADYYLLFLVDSKIKKILFVPSKIFGKSLTIKDNSTKFDEYLIK